MICGRVVVRGVRLRRRLRRRLCRRLLVVCVVVYVVCSSFARLFDTMKKREEKTPI